MVRRELNKTWWWELKAAINEFEEQYPFHGNWGAIPTAEEKRRRVRVVSYRKKNMDADNFAGGLKPILDALVGHELIWDDSPEFMELHAEIQIDMENQRTEVEVSL